MWKLGKSRRLPCGHNYQNVPYLKFTIITSIFQFEPKHNSSVLFHDILLFFLFLYIYFENSCFFILFKKIILLTSAKWSVYNSKNEGTISRKQIYSLNDNEIGYSGSLSLCITLLCIFGNHDLKTFYPIYFKRCWTRLH